MRFAKISSLATLLLLLAIAPGAAAQATSSSADAPAPVQKSSIPTPVSTALPPTDPSTAAELDALLTELASSDDKARRSAASDLADLDATVLPALSAKLQALRKSADRDAMSQLLTASRKKKGGGDEDDSKESARAKPKDDRSPLQAGEHSLFENTTDDWLNITLSGSHSDRQAFKDLVAILALSRVAVVVNTTASARELINVYTYFGDLFRIDVQRQLTRMGDRCLPALIEAQYHDSNMVRTWASRRLDTLGKAIPSEAVRTNDNQVLADVLRAYGRAREVEALRVIITFANSDRLQVRDAAREAIGQIGDAAKWQLRESYENLVGKRPDASWDWRRSAIELFSVYDRARLAEVYHMMDEGLAFASKGQLENAVGSFDHVLARAPLFERRPEMVPTYIEWAKQLRDKDRAAALAALRRAQTLDPTSPHLASIQSEILLLEARELAERGVLDPTLLHRALELDPSNAQAKAELQRLENDSETRQAQWRRYAAAVAVAVLALAAIAFVALYPRRARVAPPPASTEDQDS
jgi:hypothetical protein